MCKFYRDWHAKSDGFHGIWKYILLLYAFANYHQIWEETHFWQKIAICSGIFLHDPVSFTAVLHPEYFTFKKGVVRVETQGICTGHTLMDHGLKKYALFWVTHKRLTHLMFVSFHINLTKLLYNSWSKQTKAKVTPQDLYVSANFTLVCSYYVAGGIQRTHGQGINRFQLRGRSMCQRLSAL